MTLAFQIIFACFEGKASRPSAKAPERPHNGLHSRITTSTSSPSNWIQAERVFYRPPVAPPRCGRAYLELL